MILHQDKLFDLDYDAKTDILSLIWPDLQGTPVTEIEYAFNKLIESVKHYDVKKLLIVVVPAGFSRPEVAAHQPLILKLSRDFNTTRLEKIAQVGPGDHFGGSQMEEGAGENYAAGATRIQRAEFPDKASAQAWLLRD